MDDPLFPAVIDDSGVVVLDENGWSDLAVAKEVAFAELAIRSLRGEAVPGELVILDMNTGEVAARFDVALSEWENLRA